MHCPHPAHTMCWGLSVCAPQKCPFGRTSSNASWGVAGPLSCLQEVKDRARCCFASTNLDQHDEASRLKAIMSLQSLMSLQPPCHPDPYPHPHPHPHTYPPTHLPPPPTCAHCSLSCSLVLPNLKARTASCLRLELAGAAIQDLGVRHNPEEWCMGLALASQVKLLRAWQNLRFLRVSKSTHPTSRGGQEPGARTPQLRAGNGLSGSVGAQSTALHQAQSGTQAGAQAGTPQPPLTHMFVCFSVLCSSVLCSSLPSCIPAWPALLWAMPGWL